MIRRLHIFCPICIICIALLISCVFALNSNASAEGTEEHANASVSYTEDSWSASRIAVPAMAQETSAVLTLEESDVEETNTEELATTVEYQLTDYEREFVERIVMCEAGGEGTKGQMMVAQCIKEGMLRFGYSIDE